MEPQAIAIGGVEHEVTDDVDYEESGDMEAGPCVSEKPHTPSVSSDTDIDVSTCIGINDETVTVQHDQAAAEVEDIASGFAPPVNDVYGQQFDEIWNELQQERKIQNIDHLFDDTSELTEQTVLDVEQDFVYDDQQHISGDDGIHTHVAEESSMPEEPLDIEGQLIAEGSSVSVAAAVLLICSLIVRYKLSDEVVGHILLIFNILLPQGNNMVSSLYKFRKFLLEFSGNLIPTMHYLCSFCSTPVDKTTIKCPCEECAADLTQDGAVSYFMELSLLSQLECLWKNEQFATTVRTHRFKFIDTGASGTIRDIYDGKLYRDLVTGGILNQHNNLSFAMNTDGVPVFKSSSVSIWPVYLLVNELPLAQRKKRENVLLYGLWISKVKPEMWSYLKPLYEQLSKLENGVQFVDSNGDSFISKCVLLTCTCDLPARALVYNAVQYNGYHGCSHCTQRGKRFKFPNGGSSHIFPYIVDDPKGVNFNKRSRESVAKDVSAAVSNIRNGLANYSVNGHKGPSWIQYLKYTDVVNSCVIDYMHGVCLGVMKLLLKNWFQKEMKDKTFSFFSARDKVNQMLAKIKPTLSVTRIPRSLDDLTHWKSSEYRNFLLYWGIPILKGILTPSLFGHFGLLVRGIYLLSKECISTNDLQDAEKCLLSFVELYTELYDERGMTLNVHNLVHLTDCVRNNGPLFVNNCFTFEDFNGFLIKHIHGTQSVDSQLLNTVALMKATPLLFNHHKDTLPDNVIRLYCTMCKHDFTKQDEQDLEPGVRALGKVRLRNLSDAECEALRYFGFASSSSSSLPCFLRVNMIKKGFYVYGTEYKRLQKRQQSVVSYEDGNMFQFAQVICFVQLNEGNSVVNVALSHLYEKVLQIGHICEAKLNLSLIVGIKVSAISNICNIMEVGDEIYIMPSPNRYDRD